MKVKFSPQVRPYKIKYTFNGDMVKVECQGEVEEFDFTGMPDGEAEEITSDVFDFKPIISAKRINGELEFILLNFIGYDATYEERFPEWVEVKFDGKD